MKQPFLMDEGLLSIISAVCGQLVKILIILEPHGILGLTFAYSFILTFAEHHVGQSMSLSENAHNY